MRPNRRNMAFQSDESSTQTPTLSAPPREGRGRPAAGTHHGEIDHPPVHAQRGTGRRLLITVALMCLALGVAFVVVHHHRGTLAAELAQQADSAAGANARVDVVQVENSPAGYQLNLPGQAAAWLQSTIYARVSGYVDQWKSDIGDRVKKGQTLATIDTPELDDQLKAARAKVAADQSEVTVAQSNASFAKLTNDRWKDSPKGVVSEQERDEKEAGYASALAKLEAARSQVQFDQADVNRLEAMSEFKKVEAPYDGIITKRQIDIGDLVTAGSTSSTTPLYDIAQADKIRVFVDVPQAASTQIRGGMPATATVREYPDRVFHGTVARTSHSIDAARTLRVEVDIDNQDLALLPGMYVEVNFECRQPTAVVRIPAAALIFRSSGPQVAVVDGKGRVEFRRLTISRDMGDYVEVSAGVSPGDKVALNLSNQVGDGDRVDATETQMPGSEKQSPQVDAGAH